MTAQEFEGLVAAESGRHFVLLPFEPAVVWGDKPRYHVTGSVNGIRIRGPLQVAADNFRLALGPAWLRDSGIKAGDRVRVRVEPEGPREDNVADDIAGALGAEPEALRFFNSLATFYRKNFVRWIESAKRPEIRANRIREMVALLKAGVRQR